MRHRLPKNEQDQSFYFNQQSEDCEKTVVEPDLTNGLIRRLQDSDEDYEEEEDMEAEAEADGDASQATTMEDAMPTPPAAHQMNQVSTTPLATGALKAQEEAHQHALLKAGLLRAQLLELAEKEAEDLSTKPPPQQQLPQVQVPLPLQMHLVEPPAAHCSPPPVVTTTSAQVQQPEPAAVLAPATTTSASSVCSNGGTPIAMGKRSVSPPPLYNKAHHPLATYAAKERNEDFGSSAAPVGGSAAAEHLSFTQHSYANGLIPALKLKRPRLSEDSNFNGSSTMDTPMVPEDDDYHYLLSLHPYMKQLTAAQKLRIRTKIQKLIFKELYKEDLEESK